MPMKFNKSGQSAGSPAAGLRSWGGLLLAAAASLGVASLLTACDQFSGTLTADFVYVTSARAAGPNQYGEVDVFEINQESGRMRPLRTSPFPSGGRNPVAEAVHPDNQTLYVVNRDDNTIVQFAIGTDGKLYPQNTVNTPGIFPVAAAVSGKNLFVADTYEPLPTCSPASPCTGSVAAFPIQVTEQYRSRKHEFAPGSGTLAPSLLPTPHLRHQLLAADRFPRQPLPHHSAHGDCFAVLRRQRLCQRL